MTFRDIIKWFIPIGLLFFIISLGIFFSLFFIQTNFLIPSLIIFFTLTIIFSMLLAALWVWMLVDVVQRKLDSNEKVIWILLMVVFGGITSIVYFYVYGKNKLTK